MSPSRLEQPHELQPVQTAQSATDNAQHDDAQTQEPVASTSSPRIRPSSPVSISSAEAVNSFLGEGPTLHVDLFGSRAGEDEAAQEMTAARATQTSPTADDEAQVPATPPSPRRPPAQQTPQRPRRQRVDWGIWISSHIYSIRIALASKRGKMSTTCIFAFVQIGAIIALLVASTHYPSPAAPTMSQWDACPRRLQAFDIIQAFKATIGWIVSVWWILRQPDDSVPEKGWTRFAYRLRQDFLPYFTAVLHIVLSAVLFSTLTSHPTSWDYSPIIFIACVVALFRTWLAVAEVVLLVVGGAIYAICYASLAIFCPGILPRRAGRIGGINPTIGPLTPTQLNQIPIVQYASMSTVSLALPTPPPTTLNRLRLKRNDTQLSTSRPSQGPKRYKIEKHRAACAICLNDFVDMKRVQNAQPIEQPPRSAGTRYGTAPTSPVSPTSQTGTVRAAEGTGVNVEGGEATIPVVYVGSSSANAEENPRPLPVEPEELRLLPCEHVFHKECIDPWLKDVSGRCPTCQRPVFGGEGEEAV